MSILVVAEGLREQSASEELAYSIDVTNWTTSTPSAATAVVIDETTGSTVTSTVLPSGVSGISGTVITLTVLKLLTKGHTYRVETLFTVGSNKWEAIFKVECTV